MTVKLQVNVERMVQNLRYAFTTKTTVIAELMQNGRRAGASHLIVSFDDQSKTLAVTDDGCGITDFQLLLAVADSGWNEAVQAEDAPYGLGWLSALFSAEKVSVASNGKRLEFLTSDALGFAALQPVEDPDAPAFGTVVTLVGVKLSEDDARIAVARYASGFSIPVVYSSVLSGWKPMEQNHQLNGSFIECDIGHVRVGSNSKTVAYLQGICVYGDSAGFGVSIPGTDQNATVFHLNNSFKGRMPDRDSLVDPNQNHKRIVGARNKAWRERLESLKAVMKPETFAEKYWDQAKSWDAFDVMNDVDWLPGKAFGSLESLPEASYPWRHRDYCAVDSREGITRAEVEAGDYVLCHNLPTYVDHGANESWWAAAMIAYKRDWLALVNVPPGHWAWELAQDLEQMDVAAIFEPIATFNYSGVECFTNVMLCEKYELRAGDVHVVITDDPMLSPHGSYLVPASAYGHEALRQICDFIYDDHFDDAAYCREQELIKRCIASHRARLNGAAQHETLRDVLASGNVFAVGALKGCSFTVSFDDNMDLTIQQLPMLTEQEERITSQA